MSNLRVVESDYFMNLHTNHFTSSAEIIQVQNLIVRTHDFLIKGILKIVGDYKKKT